VHYAPTRTPVLVATLPTSYTLRTINATRTVQIAAPSEMPPLGSVTLACPPVLTAATAQPAKAASMATGWIRVYANPA
jgi:hypothetical protein